MSSKIEGSGAIAAIVAGALVLRVIGLNSGLWFDEIVTLVESARLPLSRIVTDFPGVNAHPLYSVLAHVSLSALGDSAWALRLPACLFGVASVWMAYVLGTRMIGRAEALAGTAVMATSYHHIWFSQNARGYTMLGFFALVSTLYLLRAIEFGRTRDYVIYALAAAAGIYTHLTMAFVIAGHGAALVAGRVAGWRDPAVDRWRPIILGWIGAGALSLLAYAPFLPTLAAHFGAEAPRQAAKVATGGWAIAEAIRSLLFGAGVPAAVIGGLVAIVGAWNLFRRRPLYVALLVAPVIVTAVAIVALGQPLRPRFFFFIAGAAAIFVGGGLGVVAQALGRRMTAVTAITLCTVALIALSAIALPRNYLVPKQDYAGAVRALEQDEASGARVAAAALTCMPFESYFAKRAWPCLKSADDLSTFTAQAGRPLVAYTLIDYIDDPSLGQRLRTECTEVQRFPGTLGGGDVVICDASARISR